MPIFVVLVILVAIIMYVIMIYNALVTAQIQTQEAWSTVDTHLKRRYDLIPNLVETARGYAKHESKTFETVINARNMAMSLSGQTVQKEQHENMLTGALKSLFALAENYPDLKANTSFIHLQQQITETESKIQGARENYNSAVSNFNQKIRVFPNNLIATRFNFKEERFFELEKNQKEAIENTPQISF